MRVRRRVMRRGVLLVGVGLCCSQIFLVPARSAQANARGSQKTEACGRLNAQGTAYPVFTVRAYRASCRAARAILLAWTRHPSSARRRGGIWHCRLGSSASPWFYCTRRIGRKNRAIAEAFHVSSTPSPMAPPPQPASRGGSSGQHATLKLSLSTNAPSIGEQVSVTIDNPSPGAAYEYQWAVCFDSRGSDCTVITNDTGPTMTVTPMCGTYNPYYLEAGASSPIGAVIPTESGAVVASTPVPNPCQGSA